MKVTISKTFTDDNGFTILAGRKLEVSDEKLETLKKLGVVEVTEAKKTTKKIIKK